MKNNKLFIILTNLLNSNFSAIANFLISFIVIKFNTTFLWGELVYYMSLVQVAVVVISWGNKDYLMKEFSFNPSQISEVWKENIFTRLLLVFAVSIFFGCL
jgi:hypothetical protein